MFRRLLFLVSFGSPVGAVFLPTTDWKEHSAEGSRSAIDRLRQADESKKKTLPKKHTHTHTHTHEPKDAMDRHRLRRGDTPTTTTTATTAATTTSTLRRRRRSCCGVATALLRATPAVCFIFLAGKFNDR